MAKLLAVVTFAAVYAAVGAFAANVQSFLLALAGLRLERRLGTSIQIPKTARLLSTNSILARSRIYLARRAERVAFAGREL